MSILDSIITTKSTAPRITLYGKPGIGKSTLASHFPDPLFFLTEENEVTGIKALPVATSFKTVWSNLKALLELPELPFKTLVVDSISKLDALVIDYILESEPLNKNGQKPSSLNAACGGYGAGFSRAQVIHRGLKSHFDRFKDRGVAVIYISHLEVVKHRAPDSEDYDIYTIVMNHNKSREIYIDDVDLVAFCRQKSFTSETDSGRKVIRSTSDRVILAGVHDGHVSKNRYNMPDDIEMSFNALAKHIPFYQIKEQQ